MNDSSSAPQHFVIRGADVIDGTGSARFNADVVVANGLVSAITPPGQGEAREVVDATGLVLCPGFIDTHTHDDQLLLQPTLPHPKLTQGVCTVVTGNCGISLAPLVTRTPPAPLDLLGADAFIYKTFRDYLAALDREQPCVNVVPLIGHITLRVRHVADLKRPATAAEVSAMAGELTQALDAGAFGLSTGVYYPPAKAASTEELLGVCAALKGRSAMLAMHLRDEGDNIDAALKEALDVGAASEADLVISHHKVVDPQNHGRTRHTLQAIEQAALGQSVCLDCYPYEASSTMLIAEKASRAQEVLITWSQPHPEHSGKDLKRIAQGWGLSLHEAAERLMPGGAIYFAMAAEDVERVLQHPLTMIGSDGLPHDRLPHPRLWGTFPRVLGHYSRDKKLFSLESAIHKMTGLPAQRFGLAGRGVIAPGHHADLVLLDPLEVRDNANYETPERPSTGIHAVYVNGQLALWRGQPMASHAGRRLIPSRAP
ncbi:amidohydrolase family protein [Polaromonas sp. A23]|uniref:N-acyl-D-amino-acid deacylase family protein n=1 Tax=Polaromonas sp. A23 TaxID=1944133 RepID=UPI000985A807|nr:D-aminoacylase [Polaromonas sp. A23]OOG43827.1 D-aminoacylase [Polaromonas sp. A23]